MRKAFFIERRTTKMKHQLRSSFSTQGRRMAGARALWVANGMKREQMGKPIIAIVNSFTQFVPGHVHLHEIGQYVKEEIEKLGCFAAEFNTIAIDDGIAMGHDGMLYSLPSRDIIADSVEYMVNAHKADAMVCISNCDKITPGMLMAAMRLNIPTVFVSGGPMEAGEWKGQHLDLIDAMIKSADTTVSDDDVAKIEQHACPTCGCCSGMFTANSMNCLNEAIGLALPGNGTIVATHENRKKLFKDAAKLIVENAYKYYEDGDESVLPRSIATREAFLNAMTLDIAMGGSTNTVLHLLAVAHEAGADFKMEDIDMLSRKTPCLCKVAPNTQKYHVQDVNRAGGIVAIMAELAKGGLVDTSVKRVDGMTLAEEIDQYCITSPNVCKKALKPNGTFISLDVPKESAFGFMYLLAKEGGTFDHPSLNVVLPELPYPLELCCAGVWHSTEEKIDALKSLGFHDFDFYQTLLRNPMYTNEDAEDVVPGYQSGGYVAIIAHK